MAKYDAYEDDIETHPAGGFLVGHLMFVAGLHLQALACPNHLWTRQNECSTNCKNVQAALKKR
jgi:hypothetical protein